MTLQEAAALYVADKFIEQDQESILACMFETDAKKLMRLKAYITEKRAAYQAMKTNSETSATQLGTAIAEYDLFINS